MAAYDERAALPKMPPPSPATPSAPLAFAMAMANKQPGFKNAEAAEFARIAGAALRGLVAEEEPPCPPKLPEAPHSPPRNPTEGQRSPAAPLSPLSLESESGSPQTA